MGWENLRGWCDFYDVYADAVARAADDRLSTFVEVGVAYGKSTMMMAELIVKSEKKIRFFAVDTWTESTDVPEKDGAFMRAAFEGLMLHSSDRVFGAIHPLRLESTVASRIFREFDEGVDFCFIDGAHDERSVVRDLNAWSKVMSPRGTLAGHDYGTHEAVRLAVNRFFSGWRTVEAVGMSWRVRF